MWLGLLYFTAAEAPDAGGDTAVVCTWVAGRTRPLTFSGPPEGVPDIALLLRRAASSTTWIVAPRCDACGTPLELPLD
jgi:hypothetical protein